MTKKNKLFKRIGLAAALSVLVVGGLAGCGNSSSKELSDKTITIGVTGGPHEQITQQVKKLAKKDGLDVKIKVFSDYNTPNSSLSSGDLDANSYQTLPFLKQQERDKNYKFTTAFKTVAFPMGIYSNSLKSLSDLKDGDSIAVPNDPANETRALELFQKAGVLKIKKGVGQNATKNTIASNPKHLKIVELDAAQLPKQLDEVTAAAVNGNYAYSSGLSKKSKPIYHEKYKNNPYPNYFVVQSGHKDDKVIKQLDKYYHSKTVKNYIDKAFGGSVVVSK
ncbi:lipoprotein [Paucilactobacillus hokkaidonensis JCM 18461]|uniref:Lipoprotein n=2 Tax=Paucilactobacillus hokkaidonensis TaxID=1193095 RepID=A0A0A1H0E6_9LACO|nr:MetQ/NlpA family ABC transporter substrate-binding protein [Paucilactobacillus hokkaidonensis]KRO10416.1 methionine ABC superfamily ATP binding cassette transporter, binding protein [Paucilactobacillus hokkaidonensis]BAP86733.1 lipoprotein [Paucilactobacillus hokkaidonensis JCM 18461]